MQTLKWGIIGSGDIVRRRVAPALRELPGSDIVAISRAQARLLKPFAKEFGIPRWYSNWRELLRDDEVEAVYVATPVYLHAQQTIEAAEAGKHVLCEKPMGMDVAECDRMIEACRANGVRLGIAYYRRFYPVVDAIKSIIACGELGVPVLVQINAFERFDPPPNDPRYWFVEKEKAGGGPMFDFGCHRIELIINLLGAVSETKGMLTNVMLERSVEDTAIALLRMQQGALGTVTVTHVAADSTDTLDVYFTDGSIRIPSLNEGQMTVHSGSDERTEHHPGPPNSHLPLIADFERAVADHREPTVSASIGRAVNVVEAEIYLRSQGEA
jgi:predicted dehydrogenase